MMRELFEQVRVKGNINLKSESFLQDILPIIYEGEADPASESSVPYYNSGGRALLFDKGGTTYRIKGVDPHGKLTQKVAESKENRIKNVRDAHLLAQSQISGASSKRELFFDERKPFGPFLRSQAESEMRAFKRLAEVYDYLEIENPCEALLYKKTAVECKGEPTYQTAFRLPRLEADLRVHEFDSLLTEILDACSPSEVAAKSRAVCRLYGRFIYWAGLNAGILTTAGLLPTQSSFHPQNWVINRYKEGYGIFRVDHTSTIIVDEQQALEDLTSQKGGVPHIINEFSIFPSRVQAAANPQLFVQGYKTNMKFSEILHAQKGICADEARILDAHRQVFSAGLLSSAKSDNIAPIPKDMFAEALA